VKRIVLGLSLLLPVTATVAAEEPSEDEDIEIIPVDSADQPIEDLVPVLEDVEWSISGNLQYDALGQSGLPDDREKRGELRRAYLSGIVDILGDWRVKLGVDAAERAPGRERGTELRDLSVEYRGWPAYIEVGKFVEPFGMLQGGSRNAAFMERPQASGLGPGYGIGAAVNWRAESWAISGGLFAPAENDAFLGGREDEALTLRVSGAPLRGEDALLHFGAAVSLREPDDAILQFVTIPESVLLLGLNTSSERLITEDYKLFGAEAAVQWGPVLARSEYIRAELGPTIRFDDVFEPGFDPFTAVIRPSFAGYYAEASWTLTGERRDYSVRRGMFSGIYPETPLFGGGFGAVELAVRHGAIDLIDEKGGGEKSRVSSAVLSWYPLEYVKFIVEGLRIEEEDGAGNREEVEAVQGRVQLYYSLP